METNPLSISYDKTDLFFKIQQVQTLRTLSTWLSSRVSMVDHEDLQNSHLPVIFQIVDNSVTELRPLGVELPQIVVQDEETGRDMLKGAWIL